MPLKNVPKPKYESFEDAWRGTSPKETGVMELEASTLLPFPSHRFQLYEGERKHQMIESIQEFGILMPLIVWKTEENQHIVLSGHNRLEAAKLAGFTTVPAVLRDNLTMEEATLIVTETNLRQRSFTDMIHSERAYCLAQHYEASKQQGKRNDLLHEIEILLGGEEVLSSAYGEQKTVAEGEVTSAHGEQKKQSQTTRSKLAKETGISQATFARYVKISTLDSSLMELLDKGLLTFLVAYQLAFITNLDLQKKLAKLVADGLKISQLVSKLLREDFEKNELENLERILYQQETPQSLCEKQLTKAMPSVRRLVEQRIPEESYEEIEKILDEALDLYMRENPGALSC